MVGHIKIDKVSKSFTNPDGSVVKALNEVELDIKPGSFVSLIGPSGCGKTTLLRAISGLALADGGDVYVDEEKVTAPGHERGFAFQQANLYPWLNIEKNIAFGLKARGIYKTHKEDVKEYIEMVGLKGFEKSYPHQLSGGMNQRASLARALVGHPKVLLLDEPLGALDLKLRQEMQYELIRLKNELGITFIYVTHDQEEALTMSDKVVVMNQGYIQQMGTPENIYNEPENAFVAAFIGDSNIIPGTMVKDRLVNILGADFACVDSGFGENKPVDVLLLNDLIILIFGHNYIYIIIQILFDNCLISSCVTSADY